MNSEFEIRSLNVKDRRTRLKVEAFLADNDLRLDTVEQYFGIFRLEEDDILAAGGLYHRHQDGHQIPVGAGRGC